MSATEPGRTPPARPRGVMVGSRETSVPRPAGSTPEGVPPLAAVVAERLERDLIERARALQADILATLGIVP